ncbi:chemotaxis protein [Bifidobacterium margollesii]|uniref:Chemotaxis protein n=1 Tax=Bifidobacterium margollesii TaxID=2020964 RepID=A0A2N5JC65_9BIFI|nr:DUF4012 domain-containing protein [Bifidobacterium margollesii]PLS31794.1 chemotaxis protein [Bifidobacterium margollesii]
MQAYPRHCKSKGHRILEQTSLPTRIAIGAASAILGLILSVVGVYVVSAISMWHEANRMIDSAESLANSALGCGGSTDIGTASKQLVASTRKLRDEFNSPKWTLVEKHTSYGNDIVAVRTMLDSMGSLVDGPFTDLIDLSNRLNGFSMQNKTVDVSALMDAPKILKNAHNDINTQVEALDAVPATRIGKLGQLVQMEKAGLKSVDSTINEYTNLVNALPDLLGEKGERTYLMAVYNPAELRSGGGMVGTVAEITANKGKVTIEDFNSTINFKYGTSPFDAQNVQEAAIFGDQVYRYPQTTTVNPNYQRAAVNLKNLWKAQKGNKNKDVAGVIAVDPVFLQSLVGATGSVTLDDGKVVDGTSTVRFFLKDLYVDHPDFNEQNQYVDEASKKIMNSIFSNLNSSTVSGVLKSLRETSQSGHFKMWMKTQSEFDALVDTNIINENAAGKLPDSDTDPVTGVYLTEAQPSKLDWYLQTETEVIRTCDDNYQSMQSRLTDKVDAWPRATSLAQVSSDDLGDEYTVTFTMKNTLTKDQVKKLPSFVVGEKSPGNMQLRVFLMAPKGGEITSVAYEKADFISNGTVENHQFMNIKMADLGPGESMTIAYTVRVPNTAKKSLNLVTTPIINETGIQTGSGGKVTDKCAAGKTTPAPAPSGSTSSAQSAPSSSSSSSASASGGSASGSGSGSGSGSSGDDPLASMDELKSRFSCPVDIRAMAG